MSTSSSSSPAVAVVDDDPRIRSLLADEFRDEGIEVALCESGFECLELIDQQSIDLLLLDLMMPGMDGMECLRQLKLRDFAGIVVVVTAFSDDSKRREALALGADQYIVKPELFDMLPSLIDQYLIAK